MIFNWNALALWFFSACVGFLIGQTLYASVAGLAVGLGISVLGSLFSK